MILLINKAAFLEKIKQEIDEFERFYSRKVCPEDILQQVLNRDPSFFRLLNRHQDMQGILLGYGKNNAKLFERKVQLWRRLGKLKPNGLNYIDNCILPLDFGSKNGQNNPKT